MRIDVFTLFPEWFEWFRTQRHVSNALKKLGVRNVLSVSGFVASSVRARARDIERAIAEVGYVPNAAARSLRSRRTGQIAFAIDIDTGMTVIVRADRLV